MIVIINSKEYELNETKILSQLLFDIGFKLERGFAIAVNNNVIPKTEWDNYQVCHNDQILIIKAAQGG